VNSGMALCRRKRLDAFERRADDASRVLAG
jgi:hypothetical protein